MMEFENFLSADGILILLLFFFMILFGISDCMMRRYLWEKELIPKWQTITGFGNPWKALSAYINGTKKEYGHVGIWFKLFVASFVSAFLTVFLLALVGRK